jgi:hypothetical protein
LAAAAAAAALAAAAAAVAAAAAGRRHRWTRRRGPSPDKNMKEAKGLEAAGGGISAMEPWLGRKNPGHPTSDAPYYGLFRWLPTLFGHLGTEIPTSVLIELVPVGA